MADKKGARYKQAHKEIKRRKQRDVSGKRVANAAHIGLSTYRQYEQGYYLPRADILVDLADYYGVSTDYLLGRTEKSAEADEAATTEPQKN